MGELGALFNPGMRHELEERRARAARREEEGNARDGDLRIDLESGVAVINAPGDDTPVDSGGASPERSVVAESIGPETTASDSGGSDSGGSDTGGSDTGASDTGGSDTGGSDTAESTTAESTTAESDSAESGSPGSKSAGPESSGPESSGPESGGPESGGTASETDPAADSNPAPLRPRGKRAMSAARR